MDRVIRLWYADYLYPERADVDEWLVRRLVDGVRMACSSGDDSVIWVWISDTPPQIALESRAILPMQSCSRCLVNRVYERAFVKMSAVWSAEGV